MKTNILLVYAYLVCFVTVSCGAVYTGIVLYDIVEISVPEFMISEYDKQTYLNNENFIENSYIYSDTGATSKYDGYTDEKITQLRENALQAIVDQERHQAIKSIIQSIIVLLIASVLFFVHWRIAQKVRD